MSLKLKHLHLEPTPVKAIVSPEDEDYRQSLLEEALSLLDSDLWTERKEHHGGLVETFGFPVDQVQYDIDTGGNPSKSPTGQPDGEGIAWHKRISKLKTSEYGGYDEWWAAMGANHTTQEKEYVDNLKELIDIGKDEGKKGCYLKLYKLPFGATDRAFMCRSMVIKPDEGDDEESKSKKTSAESATSTPPLSNKPGSRSFLSFSLPTTTAQPHPAEKKYVRGTTVTVERISEEDDGDTIIWTCASLSTPGGSIPVKLGESKMAASLADAVPPILKWMKKAHPKGSGPDHGSSNGGAIDVNEASSKAPVAARVTRDVKNPGGGMGLMPSGRFTLEMFQRPVQLREF